MVFFILLCWTVAYLRFFMYKNIFTSHTPCLIQSQHLFLHYSQPLGFYQDLSHLNPSTGPSASPPSPWLQPTFSGFLSRFRLVNNSYHSTLIFLQRASSSPYPRTSAPAYSLTFGLLPGPALPTSTHRPCLDCLQPGCLHNTRLASVPSESSMVSEYPWPSPILFSHNPPDLA